MQGIFQGISVEIFVVFPPLQVHVPVYRLMIIIGYCSKLFFSTRFNHPYHAFYLYAPSRPCVNWLLIGKWLISNFIDQWPNNFTVGHSHIHIGPVLFLPVFCLHHQWGNCKLDNFFSLMFFFI